MCTLLIAVLITIIMLKITIQPIKNYASVTIPETMLKSEFRKGAIAHTVGTQGKDTDKTIGDLILTLRTFVVSLFLVDILESELTIIHHFNIEDDAVVLEITNPKV